MGKLLTIGMATHDDFDGVYFSIQSLRLHHKLNSDVELIVIDTNPNSNHSKPIQDLKGWIPNLKYISINKSGTSSRDEIFKNANGKYTICMDCHVIFPSGAIDSLLKYYEDNPDCKNIVQGPMLYDNIKSYATHFKPIWNQHMYGVWDTDARSCQKGEPFEIPMMGLGVFSCETKNWLGFNKLFRGFGGEEGYIHEKFRRAGGKAICLPDFKWLHRFGRPDGVNYRLVLEDRIWNYFVGWLELTKDPEDPMIHDIYNHFKSSIPEGSIDNIFAQAKKTILQ